MSEFGDLAEKARGGNKPKHELVKELVGSRADQLRLVIPPALAHLKPDRIAELASAVVARSPALSKCTPGSVFTAIFDALTLGLDPVSPALGHAWLVPFRGQATFMLGYKGMTELAMRSDRIERVNAGVVYQDELPYFEADEATGHIKLPWKSGVQKTDNLLVAAYACVFLKGSSYPCLRVLDRAQIEARRARSQAWQNAEKRGSSNSPWHTDFAAMARKSAMRALFMGGTVPLHTTAVQAIARDEAVDEGDDIKAAEFTVSDQESITVGDVTYFRDMMDEESWNDLVKEHGNADGAADQQE